MRIGMVLDKPFPPDPRVGNEARSLVRAGHEVHLLCVRLKEAEPEREEWEGVQLHRLTLGQFFYKKASALCLNLPFYFSVFRGAVTRMVREQGIEALHIHDLPLLRVGLEAAADRALPVVSDLHENWPAAIENYDYARRVPGRWLISPERWREYERRYLPRAARVIVVVEEAKSRLGGYGIALDRVAVVSNTVHVDEFEGFPRDHEIERRGQSAFTVTYLGGFDRHRGLETAVRAVALLRDWTDLRMVLVGDGATRSSLQREAAALGVADRVEFPGWQPFRLFPSFVAGASVCLIPHLKCEHTDTTIPHKLFHYMLLERPVVATNCDPLERIVKLEDCGRIYGSGDASALADTLQDLRATELRGALGARGRAAVLARYRWDRTEEILLALYDGLRNRR